jgi:hypothetical protein
MTKCPSCEAQNTRANKFCDECGSVLLSPQISSPVLIQEPEVASGSSKKSHTAPASSQLTLRTWKPLRWLFTEVYGQLEIENDHLVFRLEPKWSHRIFRIFARLVYWGFNPLSLFTNNGENQLKNITTVAVLEPDWIKWKFHFLVIRSAGYFGVLPFPQEDRDKVIQFKQGVIEATTNAKYNAKRES